MDNFKFIYMNTMQKRTDWFLLFNFRNYPTVCLNIFHSLLLDINVNIMDCNKNSKATSDCSWIFFPSLPWFRFKVYWNALVAAQGLCIRTLSPIFLVAVVQEILLACSRDVYCCVLELLISYRSVVRKDSLVAWDNIRMLLSDNLFW